MDSFEIIINAVNDYIANTDVKDPDDFSLTRNFNNIIMNSKDRMYAFKCTTKVELNKSIKITTDFLEKLNPEYKKYFELRLNDRTFIFDKTKEETTAFSSYDEINKRRIIYIPLENNIEDVHAIIHELFHDINLDEKQESITRMFYTEGLSILGELLLTDYLKENNIKDYNIFNDQLLYAMKTKAIAVDFNLKLLEEYLKDGYIDKAGILNVLDCYPENYANDLFNIISKIVENEELTLDVEQTYVFGSVIAAYMYDRIKKNRSNINELFELNEIIKEKEFEEILDYLNINYGDADINEDSLKDLTKCYKKIYKRN